jgi:glycosyltransferase involved in cell wall biosynthesis
MLRIVAKVGPTPREQEYSRDVFEPALKTAGDDVEFLGELDGPSRDQVVATSFATLMPGAWPEPFGLVAIESLACGTPVITRRVGALPEIVREGVDGFFGDDVLHLASLVERVPTISREQIRDEAIERFSAARMADGYERLMLAVVADARGAGERPAVRLVPDPPRLGAARPADPAVAV